MDVLRALYSEHRTGILVASALVTVLAIIGCVMYWQRHRRTRPQKRTRLYESFQNQIAADEEQMKKDLQNLPPEIANAYTPPALKQEDCASIKKMLDVMKIMEISKDPKVKSMGGTSLVQAQKSEIEENFRSLGCKEYLEQIAAGEIPAPQTSPDMRPDILPSQL
jgi:predicted negative regulator of RcsB-dependent stress response